MILSKIQVPLVTLNNSQSYEEGQVLVSTGRIGTMALE